MCASTSINPIIPFCLKDQGQIPYIIFVEYVHVEYLMYVYIIGYLESNAGATTIVMTSTITLFLSATVTTIISSVITYMLTKKRQH